MLGSLKGHEMSMGKLTFVISKHLYDWSHCT